MNVLLIGASRGIGLEFARQYLQAGARVIATDVNAAKLAAERAHKEGIKLQLETYKRQIADDLLEGLVFKPVRLPESWTTYSGGSRPIAHAQHPDNHLWHDFEDWAESQDLHVGCEYDHDGVGMRSWYMLTVKPL